MELEARARNCGIMHVMVLRGFVARVDCDRSSVVFVQYSFSPPNRLGRNHGQSGKDLFGTMEVNNKVWKHVEEECGDSRSLFSLSMEWGFRFGNHSESLVVY